MKLDIQRFGYGHQPVESGASIASLFIALDLLLFHSQTVGQLPLREAGGDPRLDQRVRDTIEGLEFEYRATYLFRPCHTCSFCGKVRTERSQL